MDFAAGVDARSRVPQLIQLSSGQTIQTRLPSAPASSSDYVLVNLAFLTRDRVADLGPSAYVRENLDATVRGVQLARQARSVILISSGAALNTEGQPDWDGVGNPYGFLKNVEDQVMRTAGSQRFNTTSCRLWGASGPDMRFPLKYALGDFIFQAITAGSIRVNAPRLVWRTYCDSRQLMALCIMLALEGFDGTFDSEGPLVEIRGLASLVADAVGARVTTRSAACTERPDLYYATNPDMGRLLRDRGFAPLTIQQQIDNSLAAVRSWMDAGH
jgi:nucleoside-diphosphate-sugar epimerase